jgi:hypothetical protein
LEAQDTALETAEITPEVTFENTVTETAEFTAESTFTETATDGSTASPSPTDFTTPSQPPSTEEPTSTDLSTENNSDTIPLPTVEIITSFTLLAPSHKTHVTTSPLFTWTELPNTTQYRLVVERKKKKLLNVKFDPSTICINNECTVDTTTLVGIETLKAGKKYKWYVVAKTEAGRERSEKSAFFIDAPFATQTSTGDSVFSRLPTETFTPTPANILCSTGITFPTTHAYDASNWQNGTEITLPSGPKVREGGVLTFTLPQRAYIEKVQVNWYDDGSNTYPVDMQLQISAGTTADVDVQKYAGTGALYEFVPTHADTLTFTAIAGGGGNKIHITDLTITYCDVTVPPATSTGTFTPTPGNFVCRGAQDSPVTFEYNSPYWDLWGSGKEVTTVPTEPFRRGTKLLLNLPDLSYRYIHKVEVDWRDDGTATYPDTITASVGPTSNVIQYVNTTGTLYFSNTEAAFIEFRSGSTRILDLYRVRVYFCNVDPLPTSTVNPALTTYTPTPGNFRCTPDNPVTTLHFTATDPNWGNGRPNGTAPDLYRDNNPSLVLNLLDTVYISKIRVRFATNNALYVRVYAGPTYLTEVQSVNNNTYEIPIASTQTNHLTFAGSGIYGQRVTIYEVWVDTCNGQPPATATPPTPYTSTPTNFTCAQANPPVVYHFTAEDDNWGNGRLVSNGTTYSRQGNPYLVLNLPNPMYINRITTRFATGNDLYTRSYLGPNYLGERKSNNLTIDIPILPTLGDHLRWVASGPYADNVAIYEVWVYACDPTFGPTWTPTASRTPTRTPTPSRTPTQTQTPSQNTTPIQTGCSAVLTTLGVPPPNAIIRDAPYGTQIVAATDGSIVPNVAGISGNGGENWYRISGFDIGQNNSGDTDSNASNNRGWVVSYVLHLDELPQCQSLPVLDNYGRTATPTPTLAPTFTATASATRDPVIAASATPPGSAHATLFTNQGHVFGLPKLFNSLPYDSADVSDFPLAVQGFGQTSFAFDEKETTYKNTAGIHTGLDFGTTNIWVNEKVRSLCDGIVIPSRNGAFKGSVAKGNGVSVRCFLAPLNYLNDSDPARRQQIDPDNDSIPNLSNIVVVYNHLDGVGIDANCPEGICVTMYSIVHKGDEPLGVTGATSWNDYDHLHLEIFLARGYYRNSRGDTSVILNPLLLFRDQEANTISQWIDDNYNYHPVEYLSGGATLSPTEALGILDGQLDKWSTGGNDANHMAAQPTPTPSGNFWNVQTPVPEGSVEWPTTMFALDQNDQPQAPHWLVDFVFSLFVNDPYIAPNCDTANTSNYNLCPYDLTRLP